MYKIEGADGKQYGPITLEQLRQWMAEGRISAQTRVLREGAAAWQRIADIPELSLLLSAAVPGAPSSLPPLPGPMAQATNQTQGLAITSFVLGILSLTCFSFFTGIPAIICGHIAHNRTRRSPAQYGGGGFSIAGFIMGYVSLIGLLILPALLLPAFSKAKDRAQSINCVNNMKQIGLAFKTWEIDHQDQFPFNVSTNQGGTLELAAVGADGFDPKTFLHIQVLSNELVSTRILVCPADKSKKASLDFQNLQSVNVSYLLHSGRNINDTNTAAVLAICPVHGHELHCDGSVMQKPRARRNVY